MDENNKIIPANLKKLTDLCDAILKRTGTSEFVYFRREVYEYHKKKNLPYYYRQSKYSRRDDPFPTPVSSRATGSCWVSAGTCSKRP